MKMEKNRRARRIPNKNWGSNWAEMRSCLIFLGGGRMGTRNKGIAASRPSACMPFWCADTDLRNSRKPTAKKVRHRRHITRNPMISRAGSPNFVIWWSQNFPTFLAAGFQEFLRSALALQNGMYALGRLAAIPLFRWCIRTVGKTCLPEAYRR